MIWDVQNISKSKKETGKTYVKDYKGYQDLVLCKCMRQEGIYHEEKKDKDLNKWKAIWHESESAYWRHNKVYYEWHTANTG